MNKEDFQAFYEEKEDAEKAKNWGKVSCSHNDTAGKKVNVYRDSSDWSKSDKHFPRPYNWSGNTESKDSVRPNKLHNEIVD